MLQDRLGHEVVDPACIGLPLASDTGGTARRQTLVDLSLQLFFVVAIRLLLAAIQWVDYYALCVYRSAITGHESEHCRVLALLYYVIRAMLYEI